MGDGLVRRRDAEFGITLYELTELGSRTGDLLFELALFGGNFPPDQDIRRPGNLRTIALTLRVACQRAVEPQTDVNADLVVDTERFALTAKNGQIDVRYGPAVDSDVVLSTAYEQMAAVADRRMLLEQFASDHVELPAEDPAKAEQLRNLVRGSRWCSWLYLLRRRSRRRSNRSRSAFSRMNPAASRWS